MKLLETPKVLLDLDKLEKNMDQRPQRLKASVAFEFAEKFDNKNHDL